jgi:PHD finger-like domain-containing protein 5A
MAKHHPDLIMCRKQPGIAVGRLCAKCDGKCVICDSFVRPSSLVHICDECNYGSYGGRCVVCGALGVSDAFYCVQCCQLERDRDGCPKIVNLGSAKTDLFYERKSAHSSSSANRQQQLQRTASTRHTDTCCPPLLPLDCCRKFNFKKR